MLKWKGGQKVLSPVQNRILYYALQPDKICLSLR